MAVLELGVGNRIEPATTARSKCVTCGEPIAKGESRMAEEYSDIGIPKLIMRFYHLPCAAVAHPELLHRALDDVRPGATFDRAELEARIAPMIARAKARRIEHYEAERAAKQAKAPLVATDAATTALLQHLEADAEDRGTLLVVADQLQLRGDPRGELITVQLALAAAPRRPPPSPRSRLEVDDQDDEDADADRELDEAARAADQLARRREELLLVLGPPLVDARERCVWGIGFVRRFEINKATAARIAQLMPVWEHPSLRVLTELSVTFASVGDSHVLGSLAGVVSPSIRTLEIGPHAGGVVELVAALPRLESLSLWCPPPVALEHPTLERLSAGRPGRPGIAIPFVAALHASRLPRLRGLTVGCDLAESYYDFSRNVTITTRDDADQIVSYLRANGFLTQLTHLVITDGWLTTTGIQTLEEALHGRKLALLDLAGTVLPRNARGRLHALCDELVVTETSAVGDDELWVEHANQPAWGRGKILRRFDGKIEIAFPAAGKKVFKADAAFLRFK